MKTLISLACVALLAVATPGTAADTIQPAAERVTVTANMQDFCGYGRVAASNRQTTIDTANRLANRLRKEGKEVTIRVVYPGQIVNSAQYFTGNAPMILDPQC